MSKIPLTAQQQKKLASMWTRQKNAMAQTADASFNNRILEITRGDGTLRTNIIPPLDGDVSGPLGATVVEGLRGHPISTTAPTNNQYLKYNSTLDEWVPTTISGGGGGSGTGYWEPITNGDSTTPEIMFENGDVLMEFISD
jgi:hypothetical protein